eukprot:scaffold12132_cov103-Isochrysis_galbana.AAC.2
MPAGAWSSATLSSPSRWPGTPGTPATVRTIRLGGAESWMGERRLKARAGRGARGGEGRGRPGGAVRRGPRADSAGRWKGGWCATLCALLRRPRDSSNDVVGRVGDQHGAVAADTHA